MNNETTLVQDVVIVAVVAALLVGAVIGFVTELPAMRRYLKMRRM